MQQIDFFIGEEQLTIDAEKAIFWHQEKALILSDLHLGKVSHFRKAGIPIPTAAIPNDVERLASLIQKYHPENIIITGDFFHSKHNNENLLFAHWKHQFHSLQWKLVKGNHDIIPQSWYDDLQIHVFDNVYQIGNFIFVHDYEDLPLEIKTNEQWYFFSGHIHPGVSIKGVGKQKMQLPAFIFKNNNVLLPSFGTFTGSVPVKTTKQDTIFAIMHNWGNEPKKLIKI